MLAQVEMEQTCQLDQGQREGKKKKKVQVQRTNLSGTNLNNQKTHFWWWSLFMYVIKNPVQGNLTKYSLVAI